MLASVVSSQDYPTKPIRIVTSAAGGGSDFSARIIAQGITAPLGQPVIIDNRGGTVSTETVAKSPPDGYTLLLSGSNIYIAPLLQQMPYDAVRDFLPITGTDVGIYVLVVHPSVPVKSVKELIALAKAKPGDLNFSSGTLGSGNHLAGEYFKAMAAVNMVHIPFKGSAGSLNAVLGGEVHTTFATSVVTPHLSSGKLRALAVTSAKPSVLFAGLPTVAAVVPGYEVVSMTGMYAPAKTPATIINRLNQEVVRVLNQTDVRQKFINAGIEALGNSTKEHADTIKAEIAKWNKVIKDADIKL